MGLVQKKIHYILNTSEETNGELFYSEAESAMKLYQLRNGVIALVFSLGACLPAVCLADDDDIDDIESDMETALSESDAAQSEAVASKKRALEEKAKLQKAKSESIEALNKATRTETKAKKEISILEAQISNTVKEKQKYEKLKANAEKKIVAYQEMVNVKKSELQEVTMAKEAAKEQKELEEKNLNRYLNERNNLEKQIVRERDETRALNREIVALKKRIAAAEKNQASLRNKTQKSTNINARAKDERDMLNRKVSNVTGSNKALIRSPLRNCKVTSEAKESARVVGSIKKGVRYELFRIVNKNWVELQLGFERAYAERTCFLR
ncbi:MAG: hypothetical protein A2Z20_07505 [Bdellovibrionales bacterium RBG_16_40_8]|nr:MAG: hypothetical protein A2Z20_07505 [Bdellovibrionales bacterium RBG_16_40_8]